MTPLIETLQTLWLALPRGLPGGAKPGADLCVQRVALGKVLRGREFFKPEVQDVVGLHGLGVRFY